MTTCTENCQHIGPDGGWDHEARLEEDRGEIHTDDCGFFGCRHDHDPGECCTAGQPGVVCRVPRQSPPGGTPNRPPCPICGEALVFAFNTHVCGAASRSEQSAPRDMFEESMRDPEVRKAFQEEWARDEAALAAENPAAEAAQSPQNPPIFCKKHAWDGTAQGLYCPKCLRERRRAQPAQSPQVGAAWRDELWETHLRVGFPGSEEDARFLMLGLCGEVGELANLIKKQWRRDDYPAEKRRTEIEAEFADVRAYLYMLGRALAIDEEAAVAEHVIPKCRKRWPRPAEPGRSVSDRPPVNPTVASADPELARLLREARRYVDAASTRTEYNLDLLARIDSALSRLAGPGK